MSDDVGMRCEVVRETLSSLLDGEQQELPAQQVDAHLASCRGCRRWLVGAAAQARRLSEIDSGADAQSGPDLAAQILAAAGVSSVTDQITGRGPTRWSFRRVALIGVGVFQVAMAAIQIAGVDFGMVSAHGHGHGHGAATGAHLLHESTAWLLALGGAMIAAGIWPAVAAGVAAIAGVYALALGGYVAIDAYHGQVTAARVASHVPVLVGLAFALLVARQRQGGAGSSAARDDAAVARAGVSPAAAAGHGRRRHLRSVNSAGGPTTMRRNDGVDPLGCVFMAVADRVDDDVVTALAVAAAGGDSRALEAFIKATQHDVWRFVAYLFDGVSADDLTQETFLRAIGAIPRFAGRSSARTWLLAIARRVVADHIRYLKSRPRTAPGADPELLLDRDRPSRGFEDVVEVTALIAGLSTEQREALLLTQLFGLSYNDAAAVCGCPVGTIRSRVARARDALLADPERGELTG